MSHLAETKISLSMLDANLQKRVLDNLSTAILLLNEQLEIVYLNPSAEELFETSCKRICGHSFESVFFEHEHDRADLLHALKTGHPYTKRECTIFSKALGQSAPPLIVNYSVTVISENNLQKKLLLEFQSLDRLLKISRDETLLSNQVAAKALLRGMAHEVKNPLGGIRGAAQLLAKELRDQGQHEYIKVMIDEVDRLRNLVDRMLGPRTPPKIESLNIHEILEHVCHITEAEALGKIEIQKDYDPSIPNIFADRDQLIQASLNIMGNACQALLENQQKKPRIILRTRIVRQFTIAAKRHRMVLKIDFIDNGPGIPPDIKENIFYPMVSGRAKGTGLGLSIAQSIANQFDGIIECQSEPGETIFSLLLPID